MDVPALASTPQVKTAEPLQNDRTAIVNGKKVTAIIVGGGPIGLSTARQLDGLEYTHTPILPIEKTAYSY